LVPRGLLPIVALAAALVRWGMSTQLPPNIGHELVLFGQPWHRPPILDLLTVPFGPGRQWLAIALGALAAAGVTLLAARALPRRGVLLVAVGSVFLPSMVWAGAWWAHAALVLPLAILAAARIADTLDGPADGFPTSAAFAVWLLLLTDWPAWAPAIAWLGWLVVFPPELDASKVRRAALAVGAGIAAAIPIYAGLVFTGGDPVIGLAAKEVALGPEALRSILDSVAGVLLGRTRGLPGAVVAAAAAVTISAVLIGRHRAIAGGRGAWADVLAVGSLGAFVPALAAQPWIPIAADKHVWYMAPLVLCLGAAAVFGTRPKG
jgi:hypothetical protein